MLCACFVRRGVRVCLLRCLSLPPPPPFYHHPPLRFFGAGAALFSRQPLVPWEGGRMDAGEHQPLLLLSQGATARGARALPGRPPPPHPIPPPLSLFDSPARGQTSRPSPPPLFPRGTRRHPALPFPRQTRDNPPLLNTPAFPTPLPSLAPLPPSPFFPPPSFSLPEGHQRAETDSDRSRGLYAAHAQGPRADNNGRWRRARARARVCVCSGFLGLLLGCGRRGPPPRPPPPPQPTHHTTPATPSSHDTPALLFSRTCQPFFLRSAAPFPPPPTPQPA